MSRSIIRTALFVPGSRPERIPKAITAGADAVIVDFEDAVEEALKEEARSNLDNFLKTNKSGPGVIVRINATNHHQHEADLEFCREHSGVLGIMLPKSESAAQIAQVASCNKPIIPLIESVLGLYNVRDIASATGVERLSFGSLDLAADLGINAESTAGKCILDQARYSILLASRAANLKPAIDTVFPAISDVTGFLKAANDARDMGFGGMLCIHPKQIAIVHEAMMPKPEELDWAKKIMEISKEGKGVFVVDGAMVDAPVIERARRILERGSLN
ncbi:HpcH/HpaI aldolase/citrate lyase family protein [Marinobacterium rhizophilum]|uniref:HpcH/HpaI aldolase/citrate lyase family protein n=1 Tax=Marinobacterium rhizophilum TaxID=420402 RepID=UPI000361877E|nr:CoA ester lyase [Marinobacterium rhizophilum]